MNTEGKPRLRQTPIGAISEDWEMGAVSDFVRALQAGISVNAVETGAGCGEGDVGVLKTSAVLGGKFNPKQHKIVVPEDVARVATHVMGDRIIVSRMNTPDLVGESGYVPLEAPNLFLPDRLWQTVPSDRPHSQRWLSYWLQHPSLRRLISAGATGTSNSMKNISKETLLSLPVPLTPLLEQQKITAILTAADDILDVVSRLIAATQTLKQGLMQALFSRGVGTRDASGRWVPHAEFKESELGPLPLPWEIRNLESVANVERGKFSARPRNDPKFFEAGDIPFIQTGDVASTARFIDRASQFLNADGLEVSKLFPVGTIFITIAANIGDVAVAKVPMACPDSVVGINANAEVCDSVWLYYLLSGSKDYFVSRATQNAQKNINLQVLKPFLFALPPMPEQRRIADILATLDDKLDALSFKKAHCQTLKRGLMQKLLTGEWRVKLDSAAAV